eukprot:2197242-Pleurochrysis_carterae.AAC.1
MNHPIYTSKKDLLLTSVHICWRARQDERSARVPRISRRENVLTYFCITKLLRNVASRSAPRARTMAEPTGAHAGAMFSPPTIPPSAR